jgi:uncharacterized protein (DUF1778 family)
MPLLKAEKTNRLMRIKGRNNRSQSIGTKVTTEEETELVRAAEADGKFISEWVRDVLLRTARERMRTADPLMTEIQVLRLILINSLEPILRGERWSAEQFKEMVRYVKTNKHKVAAELMASYREGAGE